MSLPIEIWIVESESCVCVCLCVCAVWCVVCGVLSIAIAFETTLTVNLFYDDDAAAADGERRVAGMAISGRCKCPWSTCKPLRPPASQQQHVVILVRIRGCLQLMTSVKRYPILGVCGVLLWVPVCMRGGSRRYPGYSKPYGWYRLTEATT